ncbi:hypothetical protein [Streptomyces sp. NPDC056707]|uniref:hypothetical protein n=1 Tax=Streptomyces sp. NPDC056707 TaxID=3345919 RepID=UPI003692B8B5
MTWSIPPTRWSADTLLPAARRSASRPAREWSTRSSPNTQPDAEAEVDFQEAFFEGHVVNALNVLGGLSTGKVLDDSLRVAAAQVLGLSRHRVEAERWTAFRSHYGLEAFYCQPGIRGAHEKGGVEGQIGWFRPNHLVPKSQHARRAQRDDRPVGLGGRRPPQPLPSSHYRRVLRG